MGATLVGDGGSRRRLLVTLLGVSLAIGLAAAAVTYLSSSLAIPGPVRAGDEELRQRGADRYFEFCSWPKFEPRFWPECVGNADDWRERGASRLVAFCTERLPSRMFGSPDCLSQEHFCSS